jgi:hypothetical protein
MHSSFSFSQSFLEEIYSIMASKKGEIYSSEAGNMLETSREI